MSTQKKPNKGKIIIPSDVKPWGHELFVAQALATRGHCVRFIPRNEFHNTADAYIDQDIYEFKSPRGKSSACIERNLKRANRQSCNIVLTSLRVKNLQDRSIQNFLLTKFKTQPTIKKLIFINRKGEVVYIHKKV